MGQPVPEGIEARPLARKYIRPGWLRGRLAEEIGNWSGCETLGVPLEEAAAGQDERLGLAGSSSIIVATLRCLMEFYEVEIPLFVAIMGRKE